MQGSLHFDLMTDVELNDSRVATAVDPFPVAATLETLKHKCIFSISTLSFAKPIYLEQAWHFISQPSFAP